MWRDDFPKCFGVKNADMPLLDFHQAFFRELRERAADRFQLQAKITPDFLACHAQYQFRLREAARMQALHQIQEKGGQSLLCTHASQQQHDTVLPNDFPAHDFVHMALQRRNLA